MSDPILTGTNHAADRRLIDDVMAADPFDGGCAHDCSDRERDDEVMPEPAPKAATIHDLDDDAKHIVVMCTESYGSGFCAAFRAMADIICGLDLPMPGCLDVQVRVNDVLLKTKKDATAAHVAFLCRICR
jgi:hypothetical protein